VGEPGNFGHGFVATTFADRDQSVAAIVVRQWRFHTSENASSISAAVKVAGMETSLLLTIPKSSVVDAPPLPA